MTANIHKLIAAVNPDLYCDPSVKDEVKNLAKESGLLAAAEVAKPKEFYFIEIEKQIEKFEKDVFKAAPLKYPKETHKIVYDSSTAGTELLEQTYFKLFDSMSRPFKNVDKLVDSFVASPGSSYFAEMGAKSSRMQQEAMNMLGAVNQLVKAILNIIYDLKDFETRIEIYNQYKSGSEGGKRASFLSLKQIWLDQVDIKKGNTSVKAMALGGQSEFVTLLDAFMAVQSLEHVKELDLNDRVKRILDQRVSEFLIWVKKSEEELRKRFSIETSYLKSQVSTLGLYARWVKPYLKAAKALEQRAAPSAALVTAFNTVLFELALLGSSEYNVEGEIKDGRIPKVLKKHQEKKFNQVLISELNFRSTPQTVGQHQRFHGKMTSTFTTYVLRDDELKAIKEALEKDDISDLFNVVGAYPLESIDSMKEDIDHFLEGIKDEEIKEESKEENLNPFSALFSIFKRKKKAKVVKKEEEIKIPLPADDQYQKAIRAAAVINTRKDARKVFDGFKKAYNMQNF